MIILFNVEDFALQMGGAAELCGDVGDQAVVEDGAVVRRRDHHRRTEILTPRIWKRIGWMQFALSFSSQRLEMGNDQDRDCHFSTFCKIDHEIEKALGALGGHYFRLFSQT